MACNLFPAAAAQGKPAVKGKEKELQCWRKLNIYSQVALPDILSPTRIRISTKGRTNFNQRLESRMLEKLHGLRLRKMQCFV